MEVLVIKRKWFVSIWFISAMFTFSFLIIPFFLGMILVFLRSKEEKRIKKEWEENGFDDFLKLKDEISKKEKEKEKLLYFLSPLYDLNDLDKEIKKNEKKIKEIEKKINKKNNEMNDLEIVIKNKKDEIIVLDDEILYQSFGFYKPRYNLEDSALYKGKLDELRKKQKEMVKKKDAVNYYDGWELNGSKKEGQKMNNDNIKMLLYSFNTDCDNAITKLKFNNLEAIEKRIKGSFEKLNKMNQKNRLSIKQSYLNLKIEEMYLAYEYEKKKEEEKEEQKAIKEQMREEEKLRKEIEQGKMKIEKEEKHFKNEIKKLESRSLEAKDEEKELLLKQLEMLRGKIEILEKDKNDVNNRLLNTRAGYVYIISNIGSFGENIYKIGLTRRLEPMDRVNELGDASVPFIFDVHAMIFTEDAPKLESELHKTFEHRRVNMVNKRKEFFNVTLEEIEEVVRKNHNKVVEFTKLAEAEQYRESLKIKESRSMKL